MDWVHCNNCFCQPSVPDHRKFLITNCGHIFCNQCNNGTMKSCTVCHRECSSIVIESGMVEEMNMYFNDPEKAISRQLSILEFQKGHRIKFIKHLKEKTEKYKQQTLQLKEEIKRHRDDKNKLKDEVIQKNNEIRVLKKQLGNLESNSKPSRPNSSSGHQTLFSLSVNNRPDFRTFGTQLQNTPSFLQRTASSQQINFSRPFNDTSSSPTVSKDNHLFTPPPPVTSQHVYRDPSGSSSFSKSQLLKSPDFYSPPSTETPQRNIPSHRRVALPGDKGASPIGLARLSLKTPLSYGSNAPSAIRKIGGLTPTQRNLNNTTAANKYYKYM